MSGRVRGAGISLARFIVAEYLSTAIWSSTGNDDEPLDRNFSIDDFSPEAVEKARGDIGDFLSDVDDAIQVQVDSDLENGFEAEEYGVGPALHNIWHTFPTEQLVRDFWFTRNGHGVGFWARPEVYSERFADRLTNIAQKYGEVEVYVSDEGRLEFSR